MLHVAFSMCIHSVIKFDSKEMCSFCQPQHNISHHFHCIRFLNRCAKLKMDAGIFGDIVTLITMLIRQKVHLHKWVLFLLVLAIKFMVGL